MIVVYYVIINENRRVKDDSILLADCISGTIDVNRLPSVCLDNIKYKRKGE